MIKAVGINKFYGKKQVLKNIDISANYGEAVGILGKNGSGKSTLLSVLATASKCSSGSVYYENVEAFSKLKNVRHMIGYVPQDNCLFDELTVSENVHFWAAAYKQDHRKSSVYSYLGLEEIKNKRVKHLSGGMKRRLNICLSLLHDPNYVFLDEPCSGLDLYFKNELITYLRGLKTSDRTIIVASHDLEEITELCDKVYIIDNGKIIYSSDVNMDYISLKNILIEKMHKAH